MARMAGKVVLITGAAAGIGAASAALMAGEGARVAILDVNRAGGEAVRARIEQRGGQGSGQAIFLPADVTDEAAVKAAVGEVLRAFGRLDVAVNCAGGSVPADSLVTDVDLAVWDRTMNLDLRGTIHVCRHAIPAIIAAGGGAVVNMSSGAALRGGSPSHIYTAAKGAILSLTRAMAGAYARHNVRVNAICSGRILSERILSTVGSPGKPGPIADRQDASGRVKEYPFWVGKPEDMANIILFLASEESRMITGATIQADGGRSAY